MDGQSINSAIVLQFIGLLRQLASDNGLAAVETVCTENETLKSENDAHEKGYEGIVRELTQAYNDRDKYKETVERQQKQLTKLGDLSRKLEDACSKRDAAQADLLKFQRFSKRMGLETTESCGTKCMGMRTSAMNLITSFFDKDVEASMLANDNLWKCLEQHKYLKNDLSIPASNSPVAKQMRVAAILAMLGHSLASHILLPTYILEDGEELSKILSEVAHESVEQENHVRSVLLALLPKQQEKIAKKNIETVVDDVVRYAEPLLSLPASQEEFKSALRKTCKQILQQWVGLQQARPKVEPSLVLVDDDADEWDQFQLPSSGKSATAVDSKAQVNGVAKKGANAQRKVENTDIHCVLWPSFAMVGEKLDEVVTKGVVLLKTQAQQANSERVLHPVRRAPRRERRASERLANETKANGQKNFLSLGGGEGSTGGS